MGETTAPSHCTRLRGLGMTLAPKGAECGREGELQPWQPWRSVWSAARSGEAWALMRLLSADARLANRGNARGETALHFASQFGRLECVQVLLELGAESFVSDRGKTPVELAAAAGHAEVVGALCTAGHRGTDDETCRRMIASAATRSDFLTMSKLQAKLDPPIAKAAQSKWRSAAPRARAEAMERSIREEAEEVRLAAQSRPPAALPALGPPNDWTPRDIVRWVHEQFAEAEGAYFTNSFLRYHISGADLVILTKSEVQALLQRLGVPPPFRAELLKSIHALHSAPPRFAFAETRLLPVALGNAVAFRVIGQVRAAMSTPLHTLRRFVSVSANISVPLPEPFLFCAFNDNQVIPRSKENVTIVANLGFVIIVQLADASSEDESD
mmetsp:Transcript_7626/g.19455  ORF Transcript_7626/g.19455 Transcript_7626/m.19455 type:complete len:385 (-) Transcript_7626:37-1191(-)